MLFLSVVTTCLSESMFRILMFGTSVVLRVWLCGMMRWVSLCWWTFLVIVSALWIGCTLLVSDSFFMIVVDSIVFMLSCVDVTSSATVSGRSNVGLILCR